jgi:precorrin-3B methylase
MMKSKSESLLINRIMASGTGEDETVVITTLAAFDPEQTDMFTLVIIGNSQTYEWNNRIITPRGYYTIKKSSRPQGGSNPIKPLSVGQW